MQVVAGVIDPGYNSNLNSTMKIKITLSALIVFAFSSIAPAVTPAPDGGYPGGNTAEGQSALLSLTYSLKKVQQLEAAVTQQHDHFEAMLGKLKEEIEIVAARSKGQDEKVQKVKAKVESNNAAPRVVVNN